MINQYNNFNEHDHRLHQFKTKEDLPPRLKKYNSHDE